MNIDKLELDHEADKAHGYVDGELRVSYPLESILKQGIYTTVGDVVEDEATIERV